MHADYHGAATTIIKNIYPGKPIPSITIDEVNNFLFKAACSAVCRSKAWDQKVFYHQLLI